jgi:choline dehydrogenase-like flavoprotein
VKRHLPGVGDNLQDHIAIPISLQVPEDESMARLSYSILFAIWHALLWLISGTGLLKSACHPASIFYRSSDLDTDSMTIKRPEEKDTEIFNDPQDPRNIPDVEIMLFGLHGVLEDVPSGVGLFSFHTTLVQPASRGRIELASTDPATQPKLIHPMFSDPSDFDVARKAARFSLHMYEKLKSSEYPYKISLFRAPGADSGRGWKDLEDAEIDDYVRRRAQSSLHLSSSCRMAKEVDGGVVDDELRVYGFKNLRIADASVFPKVPSAHTMAPVVMVAERCADFIKATWKKN